MTTTIEPELVECACGCGELVKPSTRSRDGRSWKRGHYLRSQAGKLTALPGPDDDLDEADDIGEDLGEVGPLGEGKAGPEWSARFTDGEVPPDKPPGRLREARAPEPRRGGGRKPRVTATLRKDIHAKIQFILVPAAQVWQARDPVCGQVAVHQEPEVSDALTDIVCDSADLIAFFTGPAGGFMKYLRLAFALQPVVMTAWLHHVVHAQFQPGAEPADYREYAA